MVTELPGLTFFFVSGIIYSEVPTSKRQTRFFFVPGEKKIVMLSTCYFSFRTPALTFKNDQN